MKKLAFIFVLFLFLSCSELKFRYILFSAYGKRVELVKSLPCILNGEYLDFAHADSLLSAKSKKMIVYYDSAFCSPCQASELFVWNQFTSAKSSTFIPIFIFSPKISEIEEVENILQMMEYDFPVFIDRDYSFAQRNGRMPFTYKNFHFMLLDEKNRIDVIGMPLNNERLTEDYLKRIRE